MRHNALKTYDGKTAATTDQIPAAVTRIGHSRPVDAGNLHLQIQTATQPDFSDAVTAIDTYANEADRAKVLLFDGSGFVAIDEGGAGASFGGQSVLADVASIEPLQYVRLRWFEVLEPMRYLAWDGRYFPASGGGGGASSAAASATGTLIVTTTGEADSGWNVDGGDVYYANGQGVSLAPGQYTVFFKQALSYRPNPKPATIYPGAVTEITGVYTENPPDGSMVTVDITGPAEARWSYNGGITWIVSGYNVLLNGDYIITFKPVAGYDTPSNQTIYVEMGGNPPLTATYAAAGSGATGYSAYILGGGEPELISAQADPTKCVGGDNVNTIVNGDLYKKSWKQSFSECAKCSGSKIKSYTNAYVIKTDGTLWCLAAYNSLITQIGVATNWTDVVGMSSIVHNCTAYARNSAGELYKLQGTTAARIGSSTTWSAVSTFSFTSVNFDFAAIAIDDGKLYRLDGSTPTQIGVATNWVAISKSGRIMGDMLMPNGKYLAKNSSGALFVITATREATTAVQVGSSTDWDVLGGVFYGQVYVAGEWTFQWFAYATSTGGELYKIDVVNHTAAQVGSGTDWETVVQVGNSTYALKTNGELHKITDTTSVRVGTASDWMKLEGFYYAIAVRGTAL